MAVQRKSAGDSEARARANDESSATDGSLPEKLAIVLQESRWFLLIVLAALLALSLWGYDRGDPGWSHSVQSATLHNPAGRGGA